MSRLLYVPPSFSTFSSYIHYPHFWRYIWSFIRPTNPFFVTFPMLQRRLVVPHFLSEFRNSKRTVIYSLFPLQTITRSRASYFLHMFALLILLISFFLRHPMHVLRNAAIEMTRSCIFTHILDIMLSLTITAGLEHLQGMSLLGILSPMLKRLFILYVEGTESLSKLCMEPASEVLLSRSSPTKRLYWCSIEHSVI